MTDHIVRIHGSAGMVEERFDLWAEARDWLIHSALHDASNNGERITAELITMIAGEEELEYRIQVVPGYLRREKG